MRLAHTLCTLTCTLASAALLTAPARAQSSFIPDPALLSPSHTLIEFEGLPVGHRITTEYPGLTFSLSSDGGGMWIDNADTTFRPFDPQGVGTIQNWEPGTAPPANSPDLTIDFGGHVDRFGFVIKNALPDDLLLTLKCVRNNVVIDTRLFQTIGAFRWVGLEAGHPFDQVIIDVTNVVNGSFRIDNLRYECRPGVICDPVAPVVDITSPSDGEIVGTSSVSVSANINDETMTIISSTPAGISATLPEGGGSVSGVLPLVEGPNTITVSATDENLNASGAAITVISDTIDPGVTILSPSSGTVVAASPVNVSVSVGDATATTITFGANSLSLAAGGGTVAGDVDLAEGSNTITVTVVDGAGNTSVETIDVTLDLTAPLVTFNTPSDGDCFGVGEETVVLAATIDDLTETTVVSTPAGISETLPAGGGIVMGSITLSEGNNTISLEATDAAGRAGTSQVVLLLDTIGPNVTITSPGDGMPVRGTVEFDATATDVAPGTGVVQRDFLVDSVLIQSQPTGPPGVLVDTTTLSDGMHTFSVTAIDGKGNSTTTSVQVLVDNTLPTVTITTPLDGEILGGTIAFDAVVSDAGAGVIEAQMRVAGVAPSVQDGSVALGTPVSSITLQSLEDTTLRVDGSLLLEVTVIDSAGNQSTADVTITVDNTVPTYGLVTPVDAESVSGTIQVHGKGADANFASLRLLVDGVEIGTSTTSPLVVPFDTTTRLDGEMNVTVIITDYAGNESSADALVIVDNVSVVVKPHIFNRTWSDIAGRVVTTEIAGPNLGLMLPIQDHVIEMRIPGGPAVLTNGYFTDPDRFTFDRTEARNALEAGIAGGAIDPDRPVPIKLVVDGFEIGQDLIRVR